MSEPADRESMPQVMKDLHRLEVEYSDGDGIDFEPYPEFLSEDETHEWLRAWTGNPSAEGSEYCIFGQDGSGGLAAFWCVRPEATVLEQPIVFFGSEGELGVVASNFWDYLWLLAGGVGPMEAVAYWRDKPTPQPQFVQFATKQAHERQGEPADIVAKARAAFPDFEAKMRGLCR